MASRAMTRTKQFSSALARVRGSTALISPEIAECPGSSQPDIIMPVCEEPDHRMKRALIPDISEQGYCGKPGFFVVVLQ